MRLDRLSIVFVKKRQLIRSIAPNPKPKKGRNLRTDFDDEEDETGSLTGTGDGTPPII